MENISRGFQLDEPYIFVPWEIDEDRLVDLLEEHGLKKVTDGYYCISCKSLGGLSHELGFHFEANQIRKDRELEDFIKSTGKIIKRIGPLHDPRKAGKLRELEFFRRAYPDPKKSFGEFQLYFEKAFGEPSHAAKGRNGFWQYEWALNGIRIYHYVLDRFGNREEHLRIRRI